MALSLRRGINDTVVLRIPPSTAETLIFMWPTRFGANVVRLAFEAPPHVRIDRQEVAEANGEQSTPEGWTHDKPV